MVININTAGGIYDIIINSGVLNEAEKYLDLNRKVLIVTDSGVPEEYSDIIASKCKTAIKVTIDSGEESKNISNFELILKKMLYNEFTRKDCVVAIGGGVVGDLSGFCASCYMRGVDFYNIPTTVLSQVDSSIGGKTAIDFYGVKNIVGAFYQPKKVLIDPDVLRTLPERQINNGLAEALKMAVTFDSDLFNIFATGDIYENMNEIIYRSILLKKAVVEKDEKEMGLRKVLNFGHTLGHGIEAACEHFGMLHGECVALGMLPMCTEELSASLKKIYKKMNLPVSCECDKEIAINSIKHDKKAGDGTISAVISDAPGSFRFIDMTISELSKRLDQIVK